MQKNREPQVRKLRKGIGLCTAAFGLLVGVAAASGQDSSEGSAIAQRLRMAESQAHVLQQKASAENDALGSYRVAALFGESDEERAARLQHEQAQDGSIAGLRQRMDDVENSLRRVTGQIEQLDHRIGELNSRLGRMQKDFDYRLCTLAAQQLGASAEGGNESAIPCGGSTPAGAAVAPGPPSTPANTQESIHLAPPPGVLGTLPANRPAATGNPDVAATGPPSPSAGKPRYDAAMKLLARGQYDEARAGFRAFADDYPADELAPQAVYWIGDIAYVQKDYANAARAFAEDIKKYPESSRAAESMLKLGQSLIAMGQKQEGCTTLGALPAKYPNASKTIVSRAAQERTAAHCR